MKGHGFVTNISQLPLIAAVSGSGDASDGDLRGVPDPNVGLQSNRIEHRRGLLSRGQHSPGAT